MRQDAFCFFVLKERQIHKLQKVRAGSNFKVYKAALFETIEISYNFLRNIPFPEGKGNISDRFISPSAMMPIPLSVSGIHWIPMQKKTSCVRIRPGSTMDTAIS